ncbi:hypothetical protein [Streptomyces sp. NPDC005955]|uniref:hypothetical protein n=1 Tax=Streptomyces sp. NPDC005955 TaxID=3364738 RepID=UPI0036B94406
MPISRDNDVAVPEPGGGPPLSVPSALQRWAVTGRDRAVVTALVEEGALLSREDVCRVLVRDDGPGGPRCDWVRLAGRLDGLELTASERVFLALLLSMAGSQQVELSLVQHLDEGRLAIVLRALVRLSGNSRIAVGTRV